MSSSHAHNLSRLRGGDPHIPRSRLSQHRSVHRYSPYRRPGHHSPVSNRHRFNSPPISPPPSSALLMRPSHRMRTGDHFLDHGHSSHTGYKSRSRNSPKIEHDECPGCHVHPPSRNNNWLDPSCQKSHHHDYPNEDQLEDDDTSLQLHSPPRQQSTVKTSLVSLEKRMDHFDLVLTKLVREVADYKRRAPNVRTSLEPTSRHTSAAGLTGPATQGSDLDRLDRMMEELHFLKRRASPHESYQYSPDRKTGIDGHFGGR